MGGLREHGGRHYALQFHYAMHDDAWHVELSEANPAPSAWADIPDAVTHLPGVAFLVAIIPDEDPAPEPTVHLGSTERREIPYEIMLWFMTHVAELVKHCRAAPTVRDDSENQTT